MNSKTSDAATRSTPASKQQPQYDQLRDKAWPLGTLGPVPANRAQRRGLRGDRESHARAVPGPVRSQATQEPALLAAPSDVLTGQFSHSERQRGLCASKLPVSCLKGRLRARRHIYPASAQRKHTRQEVIRIVTFLISL